MYLRSVANLDFRSFDSRSTHSIEASASHVARLFRLAWATAFDGAYWQHKLTGKQRDYFETLILKLEPTKYRYYVNARRSTTLLLGTNIVGAIGSFVSSEIQSWILYPVRNTAECNTFVKPA